ncbi:MAG TPA: endo alpha-1,4 polygalactosaminidase [Polyangiaceae bacterium]|nr:endo alpha-1,4 polygalactosaminidase [Polyangiaceae bacterium]
MRASRVIGIGALSICAWSCGEKTDSGSPTVSATGGAGASNAGASGQGAGGGAGASNSGSGGASNGGSSGSGGAAGSGAGTGDGGGASSGGSPSTGGAGTENDGGTAGSWWKPKKATTWDWQLSSTDLSHAVDVYDVDWENDASVVSTLHDRGIFVICYVSVGSWEDFRPDAASFPPAVVGNAYPGWPGEKFVDIRAVALRSLMSARFDVCKQKGFDGLEPDNMDVFEADSGFPLTKADGLDYANWLAEEAHSRGMAVFQKNTASLATSLFDLYDGAITEDCYDQGWCGDVSGYPSRDEPVFMAEYTDTGVDFAAACSWAKTNGFSPILKDRDLTSALTTCP